MTLLPLAYPASALLPILIQYELCSIPQTIQRYPIHPRCLIHLRFQVVFVHQEHQESVATENWILWRFTDARLPGHLLESEM